MQRIVMCHWDDDLLSIPKESSSYAYFARPGVRNLTLATLLQADVVLSSSTLLGHHLSNLLERHAKAHIPVVVLPVPALQINVENIEVATSNAVNTPLTIGYGGSADQTDILQALLVPAFEKLWEQGRAINLQLVGPRVTVNARWQKFVSALAPTADYAAWLALRNKLQWHAALAPLSDGHFYRCKFYNKYLEFAAAGIPCLYSNVEPFKQVIVNGQNGLLVANTVDAWTNAITQITDKSVAQRIAANGLKDISENNNLGKVASEIKVLLAPWLGYRAPPARVTRNVKLSAKYKWVKANVVRRFL